MYNVVGDIKMNSLNIELFNYIYSSSFDKEKSDNMKWKEFEVLCAEKLKSCAYDFIVNNDTLLTMNKNNMWVEINSGQKKVAGAFTVLNYFGVKEFINYKINEVNNLIKKYGLNAFENLGNIFENMCCESVKSILLECRSRNLIDFEDYIFIDVDIVGTIKIRFEEIKVNISKKENAYDFKGIILNNYASMINQIGDNNSANINKDDAELFLLLEEKIEALKIEMQNKNCEEKIRKLENAIKNKDKKSILSILSDLASIGSFIAAMFIK